MNQWFGCCERRDFEEPGVVKEKTTRTLLPPEGGAAGGLMAPHLTQVTKQQEHRAIVQPLGYSTLSPSVLLGVTMPSHFPEHSPLQHPSGYLRRAHSADGPCFLNFVCSPRDQSLCGVGINFRADTTGALFVSSLTPGGALPDSRGVSLHCTG